MDINIDNNSLSIEIDNKTMSVNIGTTKIIPITQEKTVIPSLNQQIILPDENIDALSKVTVEKIPDEYVIPTGTIDIAENGLSNVSGYEIANVNVQPILQEKTIIPTKENQEVIADENYYGLSKVNVNAIPDEYIIPDGKLDITENGEYDVTEFSNVDVNIVEKDIEWKDVVFIDFDGTPLYSYTMEEVQELTELPPLPTRKGFTYQGWNWVLEDIKVQNDGAIVGAHCVTSDGVTRFYLELEEGKTSLTLGICQNEADAFEIDWGDGTSELSGTKTGDTTPIDKTHNYERTGRFIISIKPTSDTSMMYFYGTNSVGSYTIKKPNTTSWSTNSGWTNIVKKIELGESFKWFRDYALTYFRGLETVNVPLGVSMGMTPVRDCNALKCFIVPHGVRGLQPNAFYYCSSLETVSLPASYISFSSSAHLQYCGALKNIRIPNTTVTFGTSNFRDDFNLKRSAIPRGTTSIPNYTFYNCFNLNEVGISDTVTNVGTYAFYYCYSLTKLIFKGDIKSVGSYAFNRCYNVEVYDFTKCTTVPTLSATSAFSLTSSSKKIVVPDVLYDEWTASTNWSSVKSYIVKESEYNA